MFSRIAFQGYSFVYVNLMKNYADQLVPKVSGIWHSDEMILNVRNLDNHENQRWAWNVIDNQKPILASYSDNGEKRNC